VVLADLPRYGRTTVRETWVRTEARSHRGFVNQAAEGSS
jgi:hypothetical protein